MPHVRRSKETRDRKKEFPFCYLNTKPWCSLTLSVSSDTGHNLTLLVTLQLSMSPLRTF